MTGIFRPLRVSLLAFPDAVVSTLTGIHDVLSAFSMLAGMDEAIPDKPPFMVQIVGAEPGPVVLASGFIFSDSSASRTTSALSRT